VLGSKRCDSCRLFFCWPPHVVTLPKGMCFLHITAAAASPSTQFELVYLPCCWAEKIKREKSEVKKELVNQTLPGRPSVRPFLYTIPQHLIEIISIGKISVATLGVCQLIEKHNNFVQAHLPFYASKHIGERDAVCSLNVVCIEIKGDDTCRPFGDFGVSPWAVHRRSPQHIIIPPSCAKRGWKTELFTPLLWMTGKKKPQWDFFLFF
jgi:hypothetical protein